MDDILVEVPQLPLILHVDQLLRAVRRVRNVQLPGRVSIVVKPGTAEETIIARMMNITPSFQSYREMGILTFMLEVFAERPVVDAANRVWRNREAKVLCAPSQERI